MTDNHIMTIQQAAQAAAEHNVARAWLRVLSLVFLIVLPTIACADAPHYESGGREWTTGSDGLPREWR